MKMWPLGINYTITSFHSHSCIIVIADQLSVTQAVSRKRKHSDLTRSVPRRNPQRPGKPVRSTGEFLFLCPLGSVHQTEIKICVLENSSFNLCRFRLSVTSRKPVKRQPKPGELKAAETALLNIKSGTC